MKTVFLICGESGCGKSKIVEELCNRYGYKKIISYATRPCRGEFDNDHIFINKSDVEKYKDEMIAYTKIGDYEYFATLKQLMETDLYVIDPDGIDSLKQKNLNCNFIVVYVNVNYTTRKERALLIRGDDLDAYYSRIGNEVERFRRMKAMAMFDYSVCNKDLDKAVKIINNIILTERGV